MFHDVPLKSIQCSHYHVFMISALFCHAIPINPRNLIESNSNSHEFPWYMICLICRAFADYIAVASCIIHVPPYQHHPHHHHHSHDHHPCSHCIIIVLPLLGLLKIYLSNGKPMEIHYAANLQSICVYI